MKKRNLILPLFLGSFFITSNVDSSVFNLYETKSNNDFLIAGGDCGGSGGGTGSGTGGGGGSLSPAQKKKRKEIQQRVKDAAKKRLIESKIAAGEPLTDEEKKFISGGGNGVITNTSRINDYKKAVEYNKTDNKVGISIELREMRKKVLKQREKVNKMEQPKDVDFFEFLDNKYASLKILDLMESLIVLLMSESKKIDDAVRNREFKYSPNFDEVNKQLKGLEGINIIDDKYISSLNIDLILLKGDYTPRTIRYMGTFK